MASLISSTPAHELRVLVTGIDGFVGRHLAHLLMAQGIALFGIVHSARPFDRLVAANAVCFAGALGDGEFLLHVLESARPTHIFHLAGVLPGHHGDFRLQYETNLFGSINLLEAVRAAQLAPWILIASSSAVYGRTEPHENPLRESAELRPITHYACSKVAQEMLGLQYCLSEGMQVVRARAFNLIGPGQSATLVASQIAQQIAATERAGGGIVRVGNLTPRRDYVDVRDAVHAYWLLAASGQAGQVYNVCSGRSHSVKECVDILVELSRVPLQVVVDESRKRKVEILDQVGDPARLVAATSWVPRFDLEASLRDLLDDWRCRTRQAEEIRKR